MRRKLSLLLSAVLLLTAIPTSVFAEQNDAQNVEITDISIADESEIFLENDDTAVADVVAEPVYDTVDICDDMIEEALRPETEDISDEDLMGVSVSGNVVVKLNGTLKNNEFYYKDATFNQFQTIAEAEFITAEGDEGEYRLDNSRIYVRRSTDSANYENGSYGLRFDVKDKKNLRLMTYGYNYIGTYIVTVYAEYSDSYAEYSFKIVPDVDYVVVYVNKNNTNQTIYTDGKRQLALSLDASSRVAGSAMKKALGAKYEVSGLSKCKNENNKIIIPAGFDGTEDVSVVASVIDKKGVEVKSNPLLITITNVPKPVSGLAIGKKEWDYEISKYIYTKRWGTDAEKKLTISSNYIDGYLLYPVDENGEFMNAKLTATGDSIKITDCKDGTYRITSTGKSGATTIKATSSIGKVVDTFTIDVTAYDNSDIKLYHALNTDLENEVFPATYENVGQEFSVYAGSSAYEEDAVSKAVGNYKITVTGGKIVTYATKNSKIYTIMPTAAQTVIKLIVGSDTKQYTVNNKAYAVDKTVKNASVNIYKEYSGWGNTVTVPLKNIPADTTNLILAKDVTAYNKYLQKPNGMQYTYDNLCACANSYNSVKDGKLTINFSSLYLYNAGKFTLYAYPINANKGVTEYTAKPFKITFNVIKNVPNPSITLKSKKLTLKKSVGGDADIVLKSYKNIRSINGVEIKNAYDNKKKLNSFTSYYKLSDINISTDENGKISMSAKLVVKDPDATSADLKGNVCISVTLLNGSSKTITIPVTVKMVDA